jgi:translation elongation factor EF-G
MNVEITGPAEFHSGVMNSVVKRKGAVNETYTKNGKIRIINFKVFLLFWQKFLYQICLDI